jgi:uncharacterized protein
MGSPVTHWQILTKQPQRLQEFYSRLFGWKITSDNPLGYQVVDTGSADGIHGGMWPIAPNEGHGMVQLFIRVDDVEADVTRAVALGASVVIPRQVLPGGDEMAVVVDPDGIPFAIFKGAGSVPQ